MFSSIVLPSISFILLHLVSPILFILLHLVSYITRAFIGQSVLYEQGRFVSESPQAYSGHMIRDDFFFFFK